MAASVRGRKGPGQPSKAVVRDDQRVDPRALHDTARRYLMNRYAELTSQYATLPGQGRSADGYHYTEEAKGLYPRYNVVSAILVDIERLDGDHLPGIAELVDALVRSGGEAESLFTKPNGDIEARAMAEERTQFAVQVRAWSNTPDLPAAPLAYRRVLTKDESAEWRERLEARWDVVDLVWHPMLSPAIPDGVMILRSEALGEEPNLERFRAVLHRCGAERVIELREYGPDYELDVSLAVPEYAGAEGIWCDESLSWIAYASHEGTVSFGGTVADGLATAWSDIDAWRWGEVRPG